MELIYEDHGSCRRLLLRKTNPRVSRVKIEPVRERLQGTPVTVNHR